jgi:hypothetical protein
MGDIYSRSMFGQGYATEVGAILAANPRPSPAARHRPPDAQIVLDQLTAYGTCDQVRKHLKPWNHAAGIVTMLLPPGMSWHNIDATLRAQLQTPRQRPAPRNSPPRPTRSIEKATTNETADGRYASRPN